MGLVWTQPDAGFEEKPQDHLQSQGQWRDQGRVRMEAPGFGSVSWRAPAGREGQIPPGLQVNTGPQETQVISVQIPSGPTVHVPAVHGVAKSQTRLSN